MVPSSYPQMCCRSSIQAIMHNKRNKDAEQRPRCMSIKGNNSCISDSKRAGALQKKKNVNETESANPAPPVSINVYLIKFTHFCKCECFKQVWDSWEGRGVFHLFGTFHR